VGTVHHFAGGDEGWWRADEADCCTGVQAGCLRYGVADEDIGGTQRIHEAEDAFVFLDGVGGGPATR